LAETFHKIFEIIFTPVEDRSTRPTERCLKGEYIGNFQCPEEADSGSSELADRRICECTLAIVEVFAQS